jgi:hypothetical protein
MPSMDEEASLYPKLYSALDSQKNAALSLMFAREFATVRPRRAWRCWRMERYAVPTPRYTLCF